MKNKKKSICIISPFYNEKGNLENFIKNLIKTRLKLQKIGYLVNFVLINDGSKDQSVNIVKKFIISKKYISLINLKKNYGQQVAIFNGLKKRSADFYGVLDSDCQQNSNLFIQMINRLVSRKIDLLQMKKKYGNYEGKIKKIFSKFFYFTFSKITNVDIEPGSSDFYLFTMKVRNKIISSNISKFFLRGFIHASTPSKEYLEYLPSKRSNGISKYNIITQLNFAFKGIFLYGSQLFKFSFIFFILISFFIIFKNYFYVLFV